MTERKSMHHTLCHLLCLCFCALIFKLKSNFSVIAHLLLYSQQFCYCAQISASQLRWIGHVVRMPPRHLPRGVSGMSVWEGRPRTCWRHSISWLAWECLRIPVEELANVAGEREVWTALLRLLPRNPDKRKKTNNQTCLFYQYLFDSIYVVSNVFNM